MPRWNFEPGHTAAEFCVRHMMVTYVRGHFKNVHGTLDFDHDHPEQASVQVEINAAGLWSGEPERDEHLRSADFLDVAHHPKIAFRSTRVEPTARTEYKVEGNLTLRGVTRPVTLEVRFLRTRAVAFRGHPCGLHRPRVNQRLGFGSAW